MNSSASVSDTRLNSVGCSILRAVSSDVELRLGLGLGLQYSSRLDSGYEHVLSVVIVTVPRHCGLFTVYTLRLFGGRRKTCLSGRRHCRNAIRVRS